MQHFVIIGTVAATGRSSASVVLAPAWHRYPWTSQNADAARVVGIDTNRIFLLTFIVASALAALGGRCSGRCS